MATSNKRPASAKASADTSSAAVWDELCFALTNRSQSALFWLSADEPTAQAATWLALRKTFGTARIFDLDLSGTNVVSLGTELKRRLPLSFFEKPEPDTLVHIFGLENSIGNFGQTEFIAELNFERDDLFRLYPFNIVIWTDREARRQVQQHAKDFWHWVNYDFDLSDMGSTTAPPAVAAVFHEKDAKNAAPLTETLRALERGEKLRVAKVQSMRAKTPKSKAADNLPLDELAVLLVWVTPTLLGEPAAAALCQKLASRKDLVVLPVIAQTCDWKASGWGRYAALPDNIRALDDATLSQKEKQTLRAALEKTLSALPFAVQDKGRVVEYLAQATALLNEGHSVMAERIAVQAYRVAEGGGLSGLLEPLVAHLQAVVKENHRLTRYLEKREDGLDLSGLNWIGKPPTYWTARWAYLSRELHKINVSNQPLSDLSPLAGLLNLQELNCDSTQVSDLSPLAGLLNLQKFWCDSTQVSDLSPLTGLLNLQYLMCDSPQVSDLSPLAGLLNLQGLNCSFTRVSDLSPLAGLLNLQILSCFGTQVSDLSPLAGLLNLQGLGCFGTQVSDLSPLAGLLHLRQLNCLSTQVSDLSPLAGLLNLQQLDCASTQVSDLSPLAGLRNLQTLRCYSTQVSDLSPLAGLRNLRELLCSSTQLSNLSPLAGLLNLQTLSCESTRVSDLSPLIPLMKKGVEVKWSKYDGKKGICIEDCPLIHPPPEIAQQGNKAILSYFDELEQQHTDTLYEANMMVVGEGGAGKTSLVRRLFRPDLPLPNQMDTTRGIDILRYEFKMSNGKDFRLNVWDFGGQEIYHATHQFFLTKRSLYVLVDNSRSDHKTVHDEGFRYWLEVIDNLGEHSPVLIFQNMDGGRSKDVDMPGIKGQFGNVKELYRGDLLHDPNSVQPLREAVEFYVKSLPHVGEQLPKKWIDIRRDLESRAEQEAYISRDEYFGIYKKHLPFDRDKALWLSRYLHDLGVFLHFQDEPALRKIIILQKQLATEAVFKVLDDEQVKAERGRFTLADCDRIWAGSTYADIHSELLALMVKFELCYQLPDTRPGPDTWLTPGLLSASKPEALRDWAQPGDLVLRYHYTTFKPKGLPNRLMVRMNRYVRDINRVWRNGAYFQDGSNELLMEEPYNTSEIVLRVRGKDPKRLLTLIAADLDALNNGFGSLREKVKKKIPCICSVCKKLVNPHFYDYDNLLYRRERGKRTAECYISFEEVEVEALLGGMLSTTSQSTQDQEDMLTPTRPLRAFFSYSKSDKALLEDFKKATAALRRQNLLEAWDDSRIVAGDEWDDEIKTALREADIIFLLLSQDFLATDYIWDEEIKEAMRRHEAREARVVPILLRPCDWKGMPFEKLQGLPRKGRYIASAPNADELWLEVAQGVRAVIEDFWKG